MVGLGKRGNQLNRMIRNLVRATERGDLHLHPLPAPQEVEQGRGRAAQTRLQR